jgi:hypothetical protein
MDTTVLDSLEQQVNSGCVTKELFLGVLQEASSMLENYDTRAAEIQRRLDLCGCSDSGADILRTQSIITDTMVVSEVENFSEGCRLSVTVDLSHTGQVRDDDRGGAFSTFAGSVVTVCDATGSRHSAPFNLSVSNLSNGQSFEEATTVNIPNFFCDGEVR